ncbi:MAG: ferrochelatase [Rhizomicrobium sp.]
MRLAVVLFNLGGPDSLEAVEPFLRNLFSDPAIISLPAIFRLPLAWLIARRRAPIAREIYAKIGGRSPILPETEAQARALEAALGKRGIDARAFIAMRTSSPDTDAAARAVAQWAPDRIVLLPLYPQFSTTTTASALGEWKKAARKAGVSAPQSAICCYPDDEGFVAAEALLLSRALAARKPGISYRVLFSAHGLPQYVIARGDPYAWQVERSVNAILVRLGDENLDWRICFQSRVGPLKWLEPATDAEIRLAGGEGRGLIVVPIAFVSEHSETLVELDIEYRKLARERGVVDYIRVPTVSVQPAFIEGLAALVTRAVAGNGPVTCGGGRLCPAERSQCGCERGAT